MTASKKRFLIVAAVLAGIVIADQSGANLSFAYRESSTSTSDQPAPRTEKKFEVVAIDYPAARWLPLFKSGETVIRHNYFYPYPRDSMERQAVTRTRMTAFGFMSTRRYEELARKDFEDVSAKYQKSPN